MAKSVTHFISAVIVLASASMAVLLMWLSEDPVLHDAYAIQVPIIALVTILLVSMVLLQRGSLAARRVLTGLFASASGLFLLTAGQLQLSTSLPAASIALSSLIGILFIIPALILGFSTRLEKELEIARSQTRRMQQVSLKSFQL